MDKLKELLVYIEIAQSKGVFILQESDLLKKCKDTLLFNVSHPDITQIVAINVFIQAVLKGQKLGCYTLEEASNIFNICQSISKNDTPENKEVEPSVIKIEPKVSEYFDDDDLSSLSDPVPIKQI